VRGGRDDIGVRNRIGVQARGHEARDVRHVDEQIGADRIGNLAEFLEIEVTRIGGEARNDHLGFFGQCLSRERVVVDLAVVRTNAVLHGPEEFSGEVHLGAVREMAAVIEAHAEDGVARVDQREIGRGIRLRTGMRLHVGVVGAELLGAVDGELLRDIDELTAAVIALARITFGVLVGEYRA
jgi:hypothetical protein